MSGGEVTLTVFCTVLVTLILIWEAWTDFGGRN